MSAQTFTGARADLEARAGASDADREQWLAERRAGITATEVRDLALGKLRTQDLIDLKLGRKVDPFNGNAYTAWGKLREPVIAEQLRGEGFTPESRVFHHPENVRYLASPDGIYVGFDDEVWVLEIKTAAYDLPPGSDALATKGYVDQVQWVMFVIGAERCRFVVEERLNAYQVREGEPVFEPGSLCRHWIDRDEKRIAELVAIADGFLEDLDRQRVEGAPVIDEEVDTHAVNYLRAIDEENRWKALKEESYRAVVAAGVSQESPLARVTFIPAKPGEVVTVEEPDYTAAMDAEPDVWAAFQAAQQAWEDVVARFMTTREVEGKGRPAGARITAGKGTRA